MRQNTNLIFAFLGGISIGALATFAIMRNSQKTMVTNQIVQNMDNEQEAEKLDIPSGDKPSFSSPKTLDTRKTMYDGIIRKPDLEEVSKKYQDASFDKMNAEREYPEDDISDEDDEEQLEEADALMDHIGQMEIEETEGFGHILVQLNNGRKDSLIYLIHEEYAGEIYPLEDLTYYAKDKVVCDVTDTPVDDVNKLLADALNYFGKCGSEDDSKIYVRNATIGFEYEITRVDRYYGAHLYGVSDAELEETLKTPIKKQKNSKET